MAIKISKCSVCGDEYDAKVVEMVGKGVDEEVYSHGYCSTTCADEFEEVSVLAHKERYDMFVADRGVKLGKRLFYNNEFVKEFVLVDEKTLMPQMKIWDKDTDDYILRGEANHDGTMSQALAMAREWAKGTGCVIAL